MKNILEKVVALFFLFGFLFIPLTFNGKDWQFQFSSFIFSISISFLQDVFFQNALPNIDFSSDTIALNLMLLVLFLLSAVIVLVLLLFKIKVHKLVVVSRILSCYYIAFILLKYGFDKVFKAQFYLPEPNILYTHFGNLTKDILYWSTIGTSGFYSTSMGIIEVLTAMVILFKPTRVFGLLLSIAVFVNIILINFGFDISVKIFSIFLLLVSIFAIYPNLKPILNFLIFQKKQQLNSDNELIVKNSLIAIWIKCILIGLMFLQILYPYIQSNNFDDHKQERPFLHGVYQVVQITNNNDTLNAVNFPIQKIFVHRNNYLIFEGRNNEMTDYHFKLDAAKKQLFLFDYNNNQIKVNYEFIKKDSTFKLNLNDYHIISKAINWRKLPALQNQTHYTIDQIQ